MNNEDFERQMRFMLEQQAKFDENFAKQQEYNAQVNARLDRVDRQIEELVGLVGVLRDALIGLTHHAERHDQQIAANERAIAELAERGKETDARLNALILIVERHLSDHQ
jgi:septal ring factor EnvC (AmiA/AmiB activator)